ncbi:MAG: MFS transporter [candidate division Zixibacteria bacterium]|nr:MFS transporter [candidate division Zixibacteria bacterium]
MTKEGSILRKDVVGWSLYDFANTIYSMNIVSLYLKRYIVEDLKFDDRYFDIPFSLSMLCAAVVLPALGALSDHSTKKKIFLFLFTLSCCTAVGLMALVPPSAIFAVMLLFVIANFSYEAGQPFYNALLYSVADGNRARFVSGIGVSLGYVGSIVGMIVVLPFVTGSLFSYDLTFIEGWGKPGAFVPTAILFFLFALPLFWWVRESKIHIPRKIKFIEAYHDVWQGIKETKKYPGVLRFLIADYFFEDAVMTVIINIGLFGSVVLGMADRDLTVFLVISTVSAVIGSFLIGKIAERISLKKLVQMIVVGWIVCLILFACGIHLLTLVLYSSLQLLTQIFKGDLWVAYQLSEFGAVWVLGSAVGVLMGGLWTTTRPMLAELVPRRELGRFFGLFSLSGRAAAIFGPLVWTTVVFLFKKDGLLGPALAELFVIDVSGLTKLSYKLAVLSLVVMLLIGLFIFRKVPLAKKDSDG